MGNVKSDCGSFRAGGARDPLFHLLTNVGMKWKFLLKLKSNYMLDYLDLAKTGHNLKKNRFSMFFLSLFSPKAKLFF